MYVKFTSQMIRQMGMCGKDYTQERDQPCHWSRVPSCPATSYAATLHLKTDIEDILRLSSARMVQVTVGNTVGALQIAITVATLLFGRSGYLENDGCFELAETLRLMELGQSIGVSYEMYMVTVEGRKSTRFVGLGVAVILGGLITAIVQSFFSWRLYKLLPQPFSYIGILCIVISNLRCVAAFIFSQRVITQTVGEWRTDSFGLVTVLLSSGAVIDVIVAVTLVSFLLKKRRKAFSRAAGFIERIAAFTIHDINLFKGTGLLTSITATSVLVCTFGSPYTQSLRNPRPNQMITIEMTSVVNSDKDQKGTPQDSHEWEDVKYQVPTTQLTPPLSSAV
ncbi:uncharacterized protein LACBIDRAFT_294950 [Laccaria bicolor S238N-H82]|uniref:Predicted protein n=1 Tax=Laccaria bicolor (strain S238N-H82 / ATCC MYA-4686) TaxID=486041 RepID=B0DKF2_LACBS|nr:uncharacterized protein LACBIDRAFT_294950 [Laccaria bicolor S238N-H82]EDR04933.1 predicted protein [Laccaria bicolor S238N-H82]|eukprot:XP_001884323.1 predicted protein [Laccaria bicolor S238N-H82]